MHFVSKRTSFIKFLLALTFLSGSLFAQSESSISVGKVDLGEFDFKGFTLEERATININGSAGVFDDWNGKMVFYGWILDANTREVVWNLLESEDIDVDDRPRGILDFEKNITLKAGNYEIYYSGMRYYTSGDKTVGDFISDIFSSRKKKFKQSRINNLYLNLEFDSPQLVNDGYEFIDKRNKNAIVSMIRVGDEEYKKQGFTLSATTKLKVYAVGEGRRRDVYDYAWIYDVMRQERVWTMDPRDSEFAGGGEKNILVDETIELDAGTYEVHYVTDDSHSYDEWNVFPPEDPQYWGITIWPANSNYAKNVKPFNESDIAKPVIELTRVGDNEYVSKGFTLNKETEVKILCLGEGYSKNDLSDYGWIIEAKSRDKVWDMRSTALESAGGSSKNRMAQKIITLPAGDYIAYYETDGSHSFGDWNATPPYDREKWGLTVWPINKGDSQNFKTYNSKELLNKDVLASIIRVRDDTYKNDRFELTSDSKIRIYAIGEGQNRDMYDYGWIKNEDTGKVIWEMTYRKTEHAGGARKNRKVNDVIALPAGSYKVYYESDGSHSFRDWNSSPPDDREHYGITIFKSK